MKIKNSSSNYIKLENIGAASVTVTITGKMTDTSNATDVSIICTYSDGTTETKTVTYNGKSTIGTVSATFNGGVVSSVSFVGAGSKNAGVQSISVTYEK